MHDAAPASAHSQPASATASGLCIILLLCLASWTRAFAQDSEQEPRPTLVRGPFTLDSSFGIDALEDSNIFQSTTSVRSSPIWKLAPSFLLQFKPARSHLDFSYKGDYGWYDRSPHDDYTDHALQAGAYLLLGDLSGLDLVASYKYAHENRGAGLTQGIDPVSGAFPQTPDRYINARDSDIASYNYHERIARLGARITF